MSKQMLTACDVMEALGIAKTTAYDIIRRLNQELKNDGYITITGRIPCAYFESRFCGIKGDAASPHAERGASGLYILDGGKK